MWKKMVRQGDKLPYRGSNYCTNSKWGKMRDAGTGRGTGTEHSEKQRPVDRSRQ